MDWRKQWKPNKFSFRHLGRRWRDAQNAADCAINAPFLSVPDNAIHAVPPFWAFPPDFGAVPFNPIWKTSLLMLPVSLSQPIYNLSYASVVVSKKSLVKFYLPLCNHNNGSSYSNHRLSAAKMQWSEESSLELLIGAACSRLLKPWPGSQVRIRCSSTQQVSFFHSVTVVNSLQEVGLLKDFMFLKYPSPNLSIPEVFRCADRRRKYWSPN